jgi:hypothetical protein
MPSYNWVEYRDASWNNRYPEWAAGVAEWRMQKSGLRWMPPDLVALRTLRHAPKLTRPRVFVSHRQADIQYAVRIAWLADQEGFDFWLDVLDPNLAMLQTLIGTASLTPAQAALAIASVIEMALLNASHVLAVMTPNTRGSEWVPYEYGRAKDPTVITLQAACWAGAGLSIASLPNYLHLGQITLNEQEIRRWFRSMRPVYSGGFLISNWGGPVPASLP